MKKFLILIVMTLMSMTVSAQSMWIGGSIGLGVNFTKPDGGDSYTTTTFGLAPEFGYCLNERFALAQNWHSLKPTTKASQVLA